MTTYDARVTQADAMTDIAGTNNSAAAAITGLTAATLALAEQQRIANVLAYAQHTLEDIRRADDKSARGYDDGITIKQRVKLDRIVQQAARDLAPKQADA